MDWKINNFFPLLDSFRCKEIFTQQGTPPWEVLSEIGKTIQGFLDTAEEGVSSGDAYREISLHVAGDAKGEGARQMMVVDKALLLKNPVIFKELGIYIGQGTLLEPTAIIKPFTVIGNDCEIRQGAYIRGNVIVGENCTIGHSTEIKNSIMMNHSEAGHFAYIGDSVIGSHVNLGAGTRLANLEFRSRKDKEGRMQENVKIATEAGILNTGLRKLGAIIGDYSETGCNSVTAPGTLLEQGSWIYPNVFVKKGLYLSGSRIK